MFIWTETAHAQHTDQSTQKQDSTSNRPVLMAPTVVTATREAQRRTESSVNVDAMAGSEVRQTSPTHPSGIMNRVAGVHITELSAEGHSTSIRQPITTKPMYLYLEDGVPTRATGFFNHNALYEVNIPQSGGIEVIKGPGTALYGSDAIGGVINVLTRPAPARPTLETSFEGGSYGYARLLLSGGTRNAHQGVRADLNLTRSDGWQSDAPYHRQSGTVRWDYATPSGWTARTVATATSVDQHDVPALSSALYDARSTVNLAPIAFRAVRAVRVSSAIEKETTASLWSITPYVRHDVLQILPFWQLSYDPQVWDTRNNSVGVLAKYRRDLEPLHARVIFGVDGDYSPGSFEAQQAMLTTTGTPTHYIGYTRGPTQYNYDVTYHSVSPYVQSEFAPIPRLRFDLGLRYDLSGYNYTTKIASVDTGSHRVPPSTSVSYQHASPKVGVTYDVTPSINVYASYRHGFRAPSQSQLFQQNSAANTVDLKPVRANSAEVGVRGTVASTVAYALDAYDMRIKNDIVTYITPTNLHKATNAGETRHRGIEASVNVALRHDLRADIAYSVSHQQYVSWSPSADVTYSGNLLEQAPRTLGNVFMSYTPRHLRGGRVALEWVSVGSYEMDPGNTHTYGGYHLINIYGNYHFTSHAEVFVRALNATNRNYAEVAAYDAFQHEQFTAGIPRSIYAGVRYVWTR